MNLYTPDQIQFLTSEIKDARDIVRLTLEGRLPAGMAYISALAENGKVFVTANSPAVISPDVMTLAPDTVDKINAKDGIAISLEDAQIQANMHYNGQQHRLIGAHTTPLVTVNGDKTNAYIAVLENEDGQFDLPGGYVAGSDALATNLVDQLAFAFQNVRGDTVRISGLEAAHFSNPNVVSQTFNEAANHVRAVIYTGLERRVIIGCEGSAMTWSVPADLLLSANSGQPAAPDRNTAFLHGYALINVLMNMRDEGNLAVINPFDATRKGALLVLNDPRDWNRPLSPLAARFQSGHERSRLARTIAHP
jgi:hypothetical protein